MRTTTLAPSFFSFFQTSHAGFTAWPWMAHFISYSLCLCVLPFWTHHIQDLHDYRRHGLQKDTDVQPERAPPRIRNIETDHFLECCLVLSADLPESGHTGKGVEPIGLPQSVFLRFVWYAW